MTGRWRPAIGVYTSVFVLIMVLWALSETELRAHRNFANAEATTEAAMALRAVVGEAERTLQMVGLLHDLAQDVVNLQQAGSAAGVAALRERLGHIVEHTALGIASVLMIGPDGWTTWTSVVGTPRMFFGDRDYFRRIAAGATGLIVSPPLVGRQTGAVLVMAARRLVTEDGDFAGAFVVSLSPPALGARIAPRGLGRYGVAALLRTDDQTLLVHSPSPDGETAAAPDPTAIAARLRAATNGAARWVDPHSGRATLLAWQPVAGTPLSAVVAIDEAEAMAGVLAAERLTRVALALVSGALLAAAALAVQRRAAQAREVALRREAQLREAVETVYAELRQLLADLPVVAILGTIAPDGSARGEFIVGDTETLLGYPVQALNTLDAFAQHVPPADRPAFQAQLERASRDGSGCAETRWQLPDGNIIVLHVHRRVLERRPDGSLRILCVYADVTETVALRAQAALTGRLTALGGMARRLAHDLNQPLAIIAMAAENLTDAIAQPVPDLPSARRKAERIADQALRAAAVVQELRRFSLPASDDTAVVSLSATWAATEALIGSQLRDAGIETTLHLPEDLPALVASPMQIEQVLVNILLNARDAMARTPRSRRRLTVAAQAAAGQVVLEIADTGGGIAAEALPSLFDPYFTTKPSGTGLGLSICDGVMRSLGGSITVRNEAAGAVFTLAFPAVKTAREAA